jgi:hypothetical protein
LCAATRSVSVPSPSVATAVVSSVVNGTALSHPSPFAPPTEAEEIWLKSEGWAFHVVEELMWLAFCTSTWYFVQALFELNTSDAFSVADWMSSCRTLLISNW